LNTKLSHPWVKLAFTIVACTMVLASVFYKNWRYQNRILVHDSIGYYNYLVVSFIYEDIGLDFVRHNKKLLKKRLWYWVGADGQKIFKYSLGVSLAEMPFFLIAHQLAIADGNVDEGFADIYRLSVLCSAIFYLLLGLFYLFKILKPYFEEKSIFWTIIILALGTNLINYVIREPGMSHVYSFCAIAAFIYYSLRYWESPNMKTLITISVIAGLIALVRPFNVIVLVLFPLLNLSSFKELKGRFTHLIHNPKRFLLAIALFILIFSPQLIYWKLVSGDWFVDSYVKNESFFFNDPKIIDGLFSYRKGWLLYTPLMILFFLGLFNKHSFVKRNRWLSIGFFLMSCYLIFSWWSWWYGGSFGARPLIDYYPLFAIFIAAFLNHLLNLNLWVRRSVYLIIILLIGLNLFQFYQFEKGLIHHAGMTKKSYWMVFGKLDKPKGLIKAFDYPDNQKAREGDR